MQAVPENIQLSESVLDRMEEMVEDMWRRVVADQARQDWLQALNRCWSHEQARADAAALIASGPLDRLDDRQNQEELSRQRALASALIEAAIFELQQDRADAASQSDPGLPAPGEIQRVLRDWLRLGGWRQRCEAPLTEIGRMVERSSYTADQSVATRLGLLVPFWASLTLWRLHREDDNAKGAPTSDKAVCAEARG